MGEGQLLLTGHLDTTAMLWDLSPGRRRARPIAVDERKQEELWADLASGEPRRAWAAVFALGDHPKEGVALIRGRLRPVVPVSAPSLRQWLEDLDSADFDRRERAARSLAGCGRQAEPALRKAVADSPPLEVRRRLERLLEAAAVPHGPELVAVRAVAVLRQVGTAEARQLLAELAEGDPAAWLTQEARAALGAWREAR